MTGSRRVAVVSEHLGGVLDEGVRAFATNLLDGLRVHCEAYGIATTGDDDTWHPTIRHISSNRLFTGRALRDELADIDPQLVVYIPSASATAFAFWRATMLKRYAPKAQVALVAVRARHNSTLGRLAISEMGPDKVFAQSREMIRYMEWLGKPAQFVPAGVDLNRFRPVTADGKRALREKYRLPADEYLVLLAGHTEAARDLIRLAREARSVTPVLAARCRPEGEDLDDWKMLIESGVIVIDRPALRTEEIYQACDTYAWPNADTDGTTDVPLGVMEAMACDLPVVTYPVGGLLLTFEPGDGLHFVESDEELLAAVEAARNTTSGTRSKVRPYAWENVAERMLEVMGLSGVSAL